MEQAEVHINNLRRQAININSAFAELSPLLARIHLMSFNAKLASHRLGSGGMSFSVIVTEVRAMAAELRSLIQEAESSFREVVSEVANWAKSEKLMGLFQRSIDEAARREGGAGLEVWKSSLERGVGVDWENRLRNLDKDAEERRLWECAIRYRAEIRSNVMKLDKLASHLDTLIGRINLVASRKSDFLAITSMIESARVVGENNSLSTVSENIRLLADDISKAHHKASGQVAIFMTLASALGRDLKKE